MNRVINQRHVLDEVSAERERQNDKWGEQNHDPFLYLAILTEEVGEAAQAAIHARFGGRFSVADYRTELVQIAAVAVAAIECVDRGRWDWGGHQLSQSDPTKVAVS